MVAGTRSTSKLRVAVQKVHIKIRQVVSDSIYSGALNGKAGSSSISRPSRYADSSFGNEMSRSVSLSHRPYHTELKCEVARVPAFLSRLYECGATLFNQLNITDKTQGCLTTGAKRPFGVAYSYSRRLPRLCLIITWPSIRRGTSRGGLCFRSLELLYPAALRSRLVSGTQIALSSRYTHSRAYNEFDIFARLAALRFSVATAFSSIWYMSGKGEIEVSTEQLGGVNISYLLALSL